MEIAVYVLSATASKSARMARNSEAELRASEDAKPLLVDGEVLVSGKLDGEVSGASYEPGPGDGANTCCFSTLSHCTVPIQWFCGEIRPVS